jgi:hypothetical protein
MCTMQGASSYYSFLEMKQRTTSVVVLKRKKNENTTLNTSHSQSLLRGPLVVREISLSSPQTPILGCPKELPGVQPNLDYCLFIDVLLHKVPQNCHFLPIRGAAKFFIDLKGAANQKRLKNTALYK